MLVAHRFIAGYACGADFVAMVGEYVGTTLFLLLALGGTNVANIPNNSVTGVTTEGQDGTAAAAVNVSSTLCPAVQPVPQALRSRRLPLHAYRPPPSSTFRCVSDSHLL